MDRFLLYVYLGFLEEMVPIMSSPDVQETTEICTALKLDPENVHPEIEARLRRLVGKFNMEGLLDTHR